MPVRQLVRHGAMRFVGEFEPDADFACMRGDGVIVRTDRGIETGEVLCESSPRAAALLPEPTNGKIVRIMTEADRAEAEKLKTREESAFRRCIEFIRERRLQMELVDVEQLFGGERVVFYFLAEKRVDFRELVKDLAREFRTRIEMRQIGVRDEAKLLADYGDCGKPVCCNTHLTAMPPVSMKMAKLQKSTLDPSKISGRCGRLKCCLRYEQNVYEDFQKELPPAGARVSTEKGQGRVLHQEILARRLLIEFDDGRRLPVPADEIMSVLSVTGRAKERGDAKNDD